MTTVGENRARYASAVEARPSRFLDPAAYRAWCARADEWASRRLDSNIEPIGRRS